jgi:hypothetical protein
VANSNAKFPPESFSKADDKAIQRRSSFRSNDGRLHLQQELSKAPSSVAGDLNSERGFVIDSFPLKEDEMTPSVKGSKKDGAASFQINTTAKKEHGEVKGAPASVVGAAENNEKGEANEEGQ